ncbi:MAG: tetratricopeptide repeat protein, partial [Arenibacter sp.]|nr:tetratricopeptide repeat protein [Arenibacter sp.]
MIKKIGLLTFILMMLAPCIQAQNKLVNKANKNYKDYSFSLAIDIYKRVLDKGYVSADLLKKLGNSYYFNGDYSEASEIYRQLLKEYPEAMASDYYFRYAQTLRS